MQKKKRKNYVLGHELKKGAAHRKTCLYTPTAANSNNVHRDTTGLRCFSGQLLPHTATQPSHSRDVQHSTHSYAHRKLSLDAQGSLRSRGPFWAWVQYAFAVPPKIANTLLVSSLIYTCVYCSQSGPQLPKHPGNHLHYPGSRPLAPPNWLRCQPRLYRLTAPLMHSVLIDITTNIPNPSPIPITAGHASTKAICTDQ